MKKAFLFLLGLLASFGVQAQTSPWVGNEVKAGEFYLYNVESGLWLQNNDSKANDWSTRAAIGTRGLNFTLAGSEGAYTLGAGFGSASINPDNNYLDTGNNPAWTFTPVEVDGVTNAYKINCDNKVLGVVRYNEAGKQDNLFTQTGDERWYLENPDFNIDMTANNTWQLVTKEERLAKMQADASVDNPQDASWLIPSADFANNDRRWDNLWTHDLKGGNGRAADSNDFRGSKCVESWNSGNAIDFYISINVPNGTYKLSVQGYYRDGNVDDVVNRRNDGTETIRAYYFANEVSNPLMSILDEAKDAKVDGAWDTNRGGLWYPDSQLSANRCFNLHKGYVNPEIEVVVTTGVLKIGVRKDGGVGGDWIVVDNFKLTYLGSNIDLSTYVEGLQNAINEAQEFDASNTSTALASALSEAISAGQSALSSTDPDVLSEATAAVVDALNKAKAVDLSVLKATIALAKQEGIDTSAAEELEASATEIGPVNDALFDLRAARKVKAQAMPDIYTGSEPAEGKVYIYNLGTGLFLGTGSSYNTHCAVDQVGIEVELIASGTGFKIKTGRGGGWLAKGNESSENASVYVDSWNGDQVWQFLPVDGQEGVYNISFDGTTNDLLGYNPHTLNDNNTGKFWGSIGKMRSDVSDPMNQWKIVTAEERESLIAAASKDNPVDVSYLIKSPSMNAQDSRDADWTREVNGGNGGAWVNNTENHGYEVWNADDFKIHQTIEGLAPGLYEVSVSGFWREGDGGNQANIVNNGGALQQKAYLYANDAQALLANIASCPDFVPGIATQASNKGFFPNWPGEGLEFFETGAFKTSLNVIVEDDGTLTLGVGVDEKVAFGDWVVMDNFRLTYLGEATDNDRALASIESGKNYSIFTEIDGEKYYVTEDGHLTTSAADRGAFEFEKVTGGDYVKYGFKMKNGPWRFTNPPLVNNVANLTPGSFSRTTGNDRSSWEAQVFFKEGDLYAIRSCNVHDATSSWNDAGRTYWTYSVEEAPTPEYTYERVYLWQLEENTIVDVAYNLVYEEKVVKTENVSIATGKIPVVPQSFYTEMAEEFNGLVFFKADAEEITEETTEVNFAAESAISESFERAKWFNMNIRGSYWVTMDETEPYYPTVDKDLESEASLWAFGAVEGEPNQIVIWNRAAGPDMSLLNTGEVDANQKPLVAMREGQTAWDFAPNSDGFVIHQVGTGENEWVNQNGGWQGPLSIWNSAYAKGDGGSVLRIFFVEETEPAEDLEIAIDVERYVGQGYTPTIAEVDFTEALEYLGAEAVTEDMLYFVNPDGTEMDYATYKVSPTPEFTYDGWCDAEGAAAQWNSTTNMINVKFFEAIPDGQFSICDMNGADEVGKTYTVKWALKANDKAVVYAVNVTFVDAPELTYTFDELDKVATEDLNVKSEIGDAYEGLNATVDIDAILAALEVESLGDVIIAAVQPDGTLDTNYMLGGTDGWRDADGTWKGWSDNLETAPYFYVKTNFEATPQIYEVGGYPGHTDEAATFTAPFVFVKNGTNQAYVLNVNLVYGESGAVAYDGTVDVTGKIQGQVVAEAPTADETITITPNEDGTVNINFASLTLAAPEKPVNDFIVENVVVTENEDGSVSYSLEGATVSLTAASGMIMTYNATLTGTQAEGEGPEITLILAQPSGLQNEIVFHPNALVPEAEEFDGMIKQILSHPQTGVQGQATGDQKVTIAATGDGKADITYSGFTMPVTGAEIPEFSVEGVIVTENEDGTISYALPEDAEAEVIIDRGTGVVKYAVTLEGTQESADATPVLKLTLENSVVDTVWFGADEKTIDKAIATSIRGINALGTEGNIYDLSGRKVEKIQRGGIYIVNGKKVSVK